MNSLQAIEEAQRLKNVYGSLGLAKEILETVDKEPKPLKDPRSKHLQEIIANKDDRIKELEMALDDERAHCEEFMAEAERMKEERDEAREIASEGHRLMQNYFPDLKWIQLPWEGDEKCSSQS